MGPGCVRLMEEELQTRNKAQEQTGVMINICLHAVHVAVVSLVMCRMTG
jgi:hypothetical protein